MANGYQIDPLGIMLETVLDLKEASGRIEQRLEDGKEFHHEVRETLKEHRKALNSHGRQLIMLNKKDRRSSSSTVLEWLQVIKELWPLLLLLTTMATAVGVHVPDWLKELPQHSSSE